jgi:hypothetical protein
MKNYEFEKIVIVGNQGVGVEVAIAIPLGVGGGPAMASSEGAPES